jgi:hypothetical protein
LPCQDLPERDQFSSLPHDVQVIYHTLAKEVYLPARIIFGYNGFTKQSALRDSFAKYLDDRIVPGERAGGLGVFRLPSLISCGRHSLVKFNGIPFCVPIEDDGFWPVYGSTSGNPIELLLEIVWTRLVYDGRLPGSIFDEDDTVDIVRRFIDARPRKGGWEYRVRETSREVLDGPPPETVKWQPATLSEMEFDIVSLLCSGADLGEDDPVVMDILRTHGSTVENLAQSLKSTGLAVLHDGKFVLLTRGCQCAILPDGRFVAAENCARQLTRWLERCAIEGDSAG